MRLEWLNPADLDDNPANWRLHPEAQSRAIADVIDAVGWAGALLFNERTKRLIDGHARKELFAGKGKVPVLVDSWDESQEKTILATLDPIAAMAEADKQKLDVLLKEVQIDSAAVKELLAGLAEGNGATLPTPGAGSDEFDAEAAAQGECRVKAGDLWLIDGGKHRLLCGDSTKAEDVALVMGDERAGLMNTDPPYGVAYANDDRPNPGVAKPRVANDVLADEALQSFLESVFTAAVAHALCDNAAWYLWHAHLTQGYFAAAAANVVLHRQIIWVKPVLLFGRGHYHWKHEPCFMGWVEGHQPPDYGLGNGERTQTTVWEIDGVSQADRKEFNHSTPKPVDLFAVPMVKHLKEGEIAFEPFAGSGPQFIAAHRAGRRCIGLEIETRYCEVILRRCESEGLSVEKS